MGKSAYFFFWGGGQQKFHRKLPRSAQACPQQKRTLFPSPSWLPPPIACEAHLPGFAPHLENDLLDFRMKNSIGNGEISTMEVQPLEHDLYLI